MSSGTNENGSRNRTYWDPTYLTQSGLISKRKDASPLYAVIVVNQPIENKRQLLDLCNGAKAIVYADGGANQIFHLAKTDEEQRILVCRSSSKRIARTSIADHDCSSRPPFVEIWTQ